MAEEIHHHTFQKVDPPTNDVLSMSFSVGVIALFVVLLIALIKVIQCKGMKIRFLPLVFTLVMSGTLGFVIYFWFKLTLLEAVGLSVIITPITCLFAFIAYSDN